MHFGIRCTVPIPADWSAARTPRHATPAPLVLVAVTVLSAFAALGLGGWVSVHVFGFPALDNTTPLFAILFLVALGVDYTIFLVTRAREETPGHGARDGIVRAVSATGPVITSAGSCWPRCSACSACCR
jgi:RND superfamily putative drug exporter